MSERNFCYLNIKEFCNMEFFLHRYNNLYIESARGDVGTPLLLKCSITVSFVSEVDDLSVGKTSRVK